jgi:hypothetical protein
MDKKNWALLCQKTFDTDSGKAFLKRLSQLCNETTPTFVDQNPTGTAYKEGQRSVILYIRTMLDKNVNESKQEKAKL